MKIMTAEQLKHILDNHKATLIDVREPGEHRTVSIEGAFLMPLGELSLDKITDLSTPIIIHCHSGKRSITACQKLMAENPEIDIYSLEGGIVAWQQAGFDVIRAISRRTLSIDRQTQITVGFIGLSGTILGTFFTPYFYILPGMMGAGLMFAGISGWCGMAKFLAQMPWNR